VSPLELNQEIRSGQYFFVDVIREGVLLYDSRRFNLAKPRNPASLDVRARSDG
jgi:hypothetical protein